MQLVQPERMELTERTVQLARLDLLAQLVSKSLVVADTDDGASEMRYHLLETLRQYAHDKLVDEGEYEAACQRHLGLARMRVHHDQAMIRVEQLIARGQAHTYAEPGLRAALATAGEVALDLDGAANGACDRRKG